MMKIMAHGLLLTVLLDPGLGACAANGRGEGVGEDAAVGYEPSAPGPLPEAQRSRRQQAGFALKFKEEVSPHEVIAVTAMPGETISFEAVFERRTADYDATASGGTLRRTTSSAWRWEAPDEPGVYPLLFNSSVTGEKIRANGLVMVPEERTRNGRLGDFRVGTYPPGGTTSSQALHSPPPGFIRVTAENQDTRLSPNFRLGEFVSKQGGGWPKYLYLRERLLLKLEMLIEQFAEAGYGVGTLHIMSGYRTPYYNRAIGNVRFSRHIFGDAADVFVDADGNGRMDDISGDGHSNYGDAVLLQTVIEDMVDETWYQPFVGGLGVYGARPHRGPFIHVDTRGYRARWTSP